MHNSQEISALIKAMLKLQKKSAKTMLLECDMNKDALNTMDKGSMILADRLYRIANYLNVSSDYLLTGVEPPPKELTADETEWLELYRKLEPSKQTEHRSELRGYVKAKEENN